MCSKKFEVLRWVGLRPDRTDLSPGGNKALKGSHVVALAGLELI